MDMTEEQWKLRCKQFSQKKQTKAQFCRENNLNIYKFYIKLNKYCPHLIDHSKGGRSKKSSKKLTSFIPIKYEPPKEKLFYIHLRSGLQISFELSPEQLHSFIKTLESGHESNI